MRDHGRISTKFWASEDIQALSDSGKLFAAYLLTGPQSNMAGVYRLTNGTVSDDLLWGTDTVSERFREVDQRGFATRCDRTKWVVIHKYLLWNPVSGPKQREGLVKVIRSMPRAAAISNAVWTVVSQYVQGLEPERARAIVEHLQPSSDTQTKPLPFPIHTPPIEGAGAGAGTGSTAGAGTAAPARSFPDLELGESKRESEAASTAADAYTGAYVRKYGVPPTFNAKVRGMFANFVKRVPWEEAPAIAAYYLGNGRKVYVDAKHCVELLLRDAETLRTDWQQVQRRAAGKLYTGDWWMSTRGVEYMAREHGITEWGSYHELCAKVFLAMGDGPWLASADSNVKAFMDDIRRATA